MIFATLNRETSLLIPVLVAAWGINRKNLLGFSRKFLGIATISMVVFTFIFISIRLYFGFQKPTFYMAKAGIEMLQLNLVSAYARYSYMEVLGVVSVLPFVVAIFYNKLHPLLRWLFILIVPAWFGIHYVSVVAWESRLFLVPLVTVLMPATLYLIANSNGNQQNTSPMGL